MTDGLDAVEVSRRTGEETFTSAGEPVGGALLEFWRWGFSDLLSNATRGVLAEYIVGLALGCVDRTRREWDAADLTTDQGVQVEVKSAAYLQTWTQQRLSKITFGIQPTNGWDAVTNTVSTDRRRHADVYVFAILEHKDKATVDALNLDQWSFLVLPTALLNQAVPNQRTISLGALTGLGPTTADFSGLKAAVADAFGTVL